MKPLGQSGPNQLVVDCLKRQSMNYSEQDICLRLCYLDNVSVSGCTLRNLQYWVGFVPKYGRSL